MFLMPIWNFLPPGVPFGTDTRTHTYTYTAHTHTHTHTHKHSQPVELNPQHTNGVRGTVSVHESMKMILDAGGRVGSPLPQFPDIKQSYAIS